ncbi:hypothetical protein [Paenibacillus lautus]|uniref:hypothetical protein n=1 Tax=Paenibacillus lautus TaxID=1401 RepID=UPI001C10D0E7|nr:hypothetical protein [Paenibacillus lautus]MBU5347625.1 hypothetical protein [Paenibacillus lautus]
METVTLIVAITALALILILFIGNIINNGLTAAFIRTKKYAVVLLIMYAVSISGFVLLTQW